MGIRVHFCWLFGHSYIDHIHTVKGDCWSETKSVSEECEYCGDIK